MWKLKPAVHDAYVLELDLKSPGTSVVDNALNNPIFSSKKAT